VSGHKDAVERATVIAKEKGAKRAVLLPVSAPFHCSLMAPAADAMAIALNNVTITAPTVPLIANVRADIVTDPSIISNLLVEQMTGSVRWRESMLFAAANGVTEVFEIGAGKALSGMIRRIDRSLVCTAVNDASGIAAAVELIGQGKVDV
jgi:[acyl-carrier-protein] S-malonyltransferase